MHNLHIPDLLNNSPPHNKISFINSAISCAHLGINVHISIWFKQPCKLIHAINLPLFLTQVRGLYKGLASPLIGNSLINTILFGYHGNLLKQFDNPGYTEIFWCGSAAGVMQSIVSCPMELAKIRAQMEGVGKAPSSGDHGSIKAFANIYKMEGISGCYRGMVSTVIRDFGYGFYFVCYEYLCNQLTKLTNEKRRNMLVSIASGGLTGIVSWVVVFPVDVMKTRIQMDGANGSIQYNGLMDAFRKSVRRDGWQVLTRGLGTTAVRSFPCNAVIFPVVEIMLKIMK